MNIDKETLKKALDKFLPQVINEVLKDKSLNKSEDIGIISTKLGIGNAELKKLLAKAVAERLGISVDKIETIIGGDKEIKQLLETLKPASPNLTEDGLRRALNAESDDKVSKLLQEKLISFDQKLNETVKELEKLSASAAQSEKSIYEAAIAALGLKPANSEIVWWESLKDAIHELRNENTSNLASTKQENLVSALWIVAGALVIIVIGVPIVHRLLGSVPIEDSTKLHMLSGLVFGYVGSTTIDFVFGALIGFFIGLILTLFINALRNRYVKFWEFIGGLLFAIPLVIGAYQLWLWMQEYEIFGIGIVLGAIAGIILGLLFVIRSLQSGGSGMNQVFGLIGNQGESSNMGKQRYGIVLIYILLILIIIPIFYMLNYQFVEMKNKGVFLPDIALVLLLVAGVVVLLLVMLIFSAVFSALGLSNPNLALGLPSGSVRAAIALSFILVFVIMGIHFFSQLEHTERRTYLIPEEVIFDAEQLAQQFPAVQGNIVFMATLPPPEVQAEATEPPERTPEPVVYRVDIEQVVEASEGTRNFATQVLTALATLVAAISSFYFATRSQEQDEPPEGVAQITDQPPSLLGIPNPPFVAPNTDIAVHLYGTNLSSVTTVKFKLGDSEVSAEVESGNSNEIVTKSMRLETVGFWGISLTTAGGQWYSTAVQLEVREQ